MSYVSKLNLMKRNSLLQNFIMLVLLLASWSSAPAAIGVGSRVAVNGFDIRVRMSPGGTDYPVRQQNGVTGSVIGGPTNAQIGGTGLTYTWWNVDFDSGQDGWIAADFLVVVSSQPGSFTLSNETPYWNVSNPAVRLNWTSSSGATSYDLYRNASLYTSGLTGNTFLNTGSNVAAGATYTYFIRAKNGAFYRDSNTVSATMPNAPGSVPNAPSNLNAFPSQGRVSMTWSDNSSNESGFRIERKAGAGGSWSEIGTTSANAQSHVDLSVAGSTTYFYRVRAFNGTGNSGFSNEANAITPSSENAPNAPGSMGFTNLQATQVTLSWLDNSTNETGFSLERKTGSGGSWLVLATVAANPSSIAYYVDTSISSGNQYFYRVRAFNSGGNSNYSPELSVNTLVPQPPVAPSGLAAVVSGTLITLTWFEISPNELGFKIERKTGISGNWTEIHTTAANVTSYVNSGVSAGVTYYYRVRAYNSAGNSAYSNEATAQTTSVSSPTISSVSPNPVTGSITAQAFTINGANFQTNCNVTLRDLSTGISYPNRAISSFTSTRIVINSVFGLAQASWTVQVINPDNGSTTAFGFLVNSPATIAPQIQSITPNPIVGSKSSQVITIKGSGFTAQSRVLAGFKDNGYQLVQTSIAPTFVDSATLTIPIVTDTTEDVWKLSVRNADGGQASPFNWIVRAPAAVSVTVTSPNGGETFQSGESRTVSWTTSGETSNISRYNLTYSTQSGSTGTFSNHIASVNAPAQSFVWTVPNGVNVSTVRVRVEGVNASGSGLAADGSNANFTITNGAPIPPVVAISQPVNGASWTAGTTQSISWTVSGNIPAQINRFVGSYSLNNGSTFTDLATINTSSSRSHPWPIPVSLTSSQARVRITALDASGNVLHAGTSGTFSISAPSETRPTARIDASLNGNVFSGAPVQFKGDRSSGSVAGCAIVGYSWDFGDNSPGSTLANPQHIYTVASGSRSFTVRLTVTDCQGKTASAQTTVVVGAQTQSSNNPSSHSPDPVNLATGHYFSDHLDLKLPGVGIPFEFTRHYNSNGSRHTEQPFGPGWTHAFLENVVENADGTVSVLRGDGNVDTFTAGARGTYIPEPGKYDVLSKDLEGRYILTSKSGVSRYFNAVRKLEMLRDRNNNTLQIIYATDGTIDKFIDTAGRTIEVTSDAQGRIISLTDPLNRTVQYAYNAQGDLITHTDKKGGVTRYGYDEHHQIISVIDPNGNTLVTNVYDDLNRVVTSQKDALNGQTLFNYDFVARVTVMTDALGHKSYHRHDDQLRVTSITDTRGNTESYVYDANSNRIKITDKRGGVTTYTYDARGNVTGKTDALGQKTSIRYNALNLPLERRDAAGALTKFAYDARGNLISLTNPLGAVTRTTYDGRGLPGGMTDPLGRQTIMEYDVQGNLILTRDALLNETKQEFDAVGRLTAIVDPKLARAEHEYDGEDKLVKTRDPSGHEVRNLYDPNGNLTQTTDQRSHETKSFYDPKDRLIRVERPHNSKASQTYDGMDRKVTATDALNNTTHLEYDSEGNLTRAKDARNNETWFEYDANGNRTKVIDPLGNVSWVEYDRLNRPVRSGDPLGNISRTEYDAVGRKLRQIDALGRATVFRYDRAGRLQSVTDPAGGSVRFTYDRVGNRVTRTDQRGNTTRFTYDALNRVKTMAEPTGATTQYDYDAVGNMVWKKDPKGQITEFTYGPRRTLDRVRYADDSEVTFTYDAAGNRMGMTDSLGSSSWEYDGLNRVTKHTDPFGQQLAYSYDAQGNQTSIVYPGNKTVTYKYDQLHRMIEVKDWQQRVTSYAYDPSGRPLNIANANQTAASLLYDKAGRVIELNHTGPEESLIAKYAISLDAVGNHRQVEQQEPLNALPPEEDIVYSYDKDNRLTKAGSVTFDYDANGNTIRRGADAFSYNTTDRLSQAIQGGVVYNYGYDGLGNRLVRTLGDQTTRFVVDLNNGLSRILCETTATGTVQARYVYGLNLVSRIAADDSVQYYHGDVRGSTVALTGASGSVTDKYAYDEFGVSLAQEGNTANPFRYLGRAGIYDEGNDLLHIRARYYTPSLGRFHSKDPFPANDEDGRTLHRYVYAFNNPVRYIDPTGWTPREIVTVSTSYKTSTPQIYTSSDKSELNNYLLHSAVEVAAEELLERGSKYVVNNNGFNALGKFAYGVSQHVPLVTIGVSAAYDAFNDTVANPSRTNSEVLARFNFDLAYGAVSGLGAAALSTAIVGAGVLSAPIAVPAAGVAAGIIYGLTREPVQNSFINLFSN
jgi:RHS repeat-associated protein